MKIFQVLPELQSAPEIRGEHQWHLPSIKCSSCGIVWGDCSVAYPWVDPSNLPNRKQFKGIQVVPHLEFEKAIESIRKLVSPDIPLVPGALLAVFKGKHTSGILRDFYFDWCKHFVTRNAYESLRCRGALEVGMTPAAIKGKKGGMLDYVELHLVPRAKLAVPRIQKSGQKYCPVCGFDQRSMPEPLVVLRSSIPLNEQVFQVQDSLGIRLATEKFVEAVSSLGLTGLEFQNVVVVEKEIS